MTIDLPALGLHNIPHLTLLIGNSGSGKTYLSQQLSEQWQARVIDLDPLAWNPGQPPTRRPAEDSIHDFEADLSKRTIVEGCYEDIMQLLLPRQPLLLFLNPPLERCLENCRARPWEPHKFPTREAQEQQLDFLLGWVRSYYQRDDALSLQAHRRLFDSYSGPKLELTP